MADEPATRAKSSGTFGFLARKLGPFPIWVWALIGFGLYYWYTHFGPGAKKAKATAAQAKPRGSGRTTVNITLRPDRNGRLRPETGPANRNAQVAAATAPGFEPGQVVTQQGPVYDAWSPAEDQPAMAYAPMTPGSIYG